MTLATEADFAVADEIMNALEVRTGPTLREIIAEKIAIRAAQACLEQLLLDPTITPTIGWKHEE